MMKMQRPYLSPFLLVCYLSTSITGILMLLHVGFPAIHPIHEWGGVAFVIGGLLHLILNWRALTTYFKPKLRFTVFIPEQERPRRQRLGGAQTSMVTSPSTLTGSSMVTNSRTIASNSANSEAELSAPTAIIASSQ
ncbi:DUF4405 domain-containing protein [Vibrio porteresiae]|uniref:DUF4405 domain-containing protein n=1 Tax=Vibrio porteresiae DSM 19223 TaxID=1123496 RepID=A0ABZ0QB89_9VIBR|nr:DUF4405 domain-containing protein [Vibrio porteresiae]WPC72845.1 DUF4405 domain-containing protein [Vibrio porteresiae DSM 19223]